VSTVHLKSRRGQLGIAREPITRLWFWHCRVCPGWPTVGHAATHPASVERALHHAANSSAHRLALEDAAS
jgi:hypothetical protein